MVSKSWSYTLNNYDDKDVTFFEKLEGITRHRCAKEIGESGTPHLQGVVCFRKAYRLSALKKLHDRVHWEPTKSLDHSINYCGKGDVIIDFFFSAQGMRSDIKVACDMIKDGKNMIEVATNYPDVYVKYNRGMEKLEHLLAKLPKDFPTEVLVFHGPSGCGKSRKAREIDPNLYNVMTPNGKGGALWFDGYNGEETILFDDFYGWVSYELILQITDRYPMKVNVKGSTVHRRWTRVIFTSNKSPLGWWEEMPNPKAFLRRCTKNEILG